MLASFPAWFEHRMQAQLVHAPMSAAMHYHMNLLSTRKATQDNRIQVPSAMHASLVTVQGRDCELFL